LRETKFSKSATRESSTCGHRGDHELRHHRPKVLARARAAGTYSVAYEPGGLVVPLTVEKIDRILQSGGDTMVVLGGDEHVAIERGDLVSPLPRMRLRVLSERWRQRFIEQREPVVGDVYELEYRTASPLRD